MACTRVCDQTIYNRNLNYGQALNYIQSASYLPDSDFNEDFRARQGLAFKAIDHFEENISHQFEKYGDTYGNNVEDIVNEPIRKKRNAVEELKEMENLFDEDPDIDIFGDNPEFEEIHGDRQKRFLDCVSPAPLAVRRRREVCSL